MLRFIQDWLDRRDALKAIARDRRDNRDVAKGLFGAALEQAEAAVAADQYGQALGVWREIKERFHPEALHSQRMFKVLMRSRAYDEAEELMRHGLKQHPNERHFIFGLAYVATDRGDLEAALERWTVAQKKFPGLSEPYAGLAGSLVKVGRLDEADAALKKGLAQDRNDTVCLMAWARLAETRGNFDEALARWEYMRETMPDIGHPTYQNGTLGLASCLRVMGRFDEAVRLVEDYITKIGRQEAPVAELARIAEARGDWDEAIRQWDRFRQSFPMNQLGYTALLGASRTVGDLERVQETYLQMMDRLPDLSWPAIEYAKMAESSHDLEESAKRWKLANERHPHVEETYIARARILTALDRADEAAEVRREHADRFATVKGQ